MNDLQNEIPLLLEVGEKFTFETFSSKSARGFPNALSDDWLYWTHKVGVFVKHLEEGSPATQSIHEGLNVRLLGNGEDSFAKAKGQIVNGLRAAARLLDASQNIPASDRLVTLDHNSQSYLQAVDKLQQLIQSVQQLNDYPDQDDKNRELPN